MVEVFGRENNPESLISLLLATLEGKLGVRRAWRLEACSKGVTAHAISRTQAGATPEIDSDLVSRSAQKGWSMSQSSGRSALCVSLPEMKGAQHFLFLERSAQAPFCEWEAEYAALLAEAAAEIFAIAASERAVRAESSRTRDMEATLRAILDDTAGVTGAELFPRLIERLATALQMGFAFATELQPDKRRARMLAFWLGNGFYGDFEYDLEHTPCEGVIRGEIGYYPRNLQALFPKHEDLVTLGIESYLGIPMFRSTGEVIGHIAVMDSRPMDDSWLTLPILKTFAVRGAAELERYRDHERLQQALDEVRRLEKRLREENTYLREEIGGEYNFHEIIGQSPALMKLLKKIRQVAPTDSTALILGETGVGKELIARAIHDGSRRRERPLVKVNCGAISAGLVESELFGHVRGAFTGALDKRVGRFELAHGGTIFLDEVGELPPETQVKLLRVLQEHEFEPVGSSQTKKVDVRVIAATNRNLETAVQQGRFRADLYYRLNVFPIEAPPLRDRRADIPLLAEYFAGQCARRFGKDIESIEGESVQRLQAYSWPGNVRELQNVVERAVVLADGPTLVFAAEMFPALRTASVQPEVPLAGGAGSLVETEKRHIAAALEKANWVIEGPRGAALALGLHPNTLRSRMRKLGIARPSAERA